MNVFHKVTLQSLRKNKVRTIVTVIGVMLSAAMICAVTTFVSSIRNFALQYAIYTDGNWHGAVQDATFDDLQAIESSGKTTDRAYCRVYGYATVDSINQFKPYLYVLGGDRENFFDTVPIHLTEGRLPANDQEIILPEHLSENGGIAWKVGDTLTLEIGNRTLDGYTLGQDNPCYEYDPDTRRDQRTNEIILNTRKRSFTVVGIYERPTFEPRTAPGYTALTVEDPAWDVSSAIHIYFSMKEPADVYNYMRDMGFAKKYSYDFNSDVLLYSGVSYYDSLSAVLYCLAAIVIGLIIFGSVSLIYNAFSISVSERTKQFGLLSSVGATKKQLKRMVMFEALAVSAVGIPLGILAGIGGIGITLALIGEKFYSLIGGAKVPMRLCVSWQAVAVAALLALVTVLISAWIPSLRATRVTAVEAIRQNMDIKNTKPIRTSRLTYKLFGLPGVLAGQYYWRSKKKYRATVVSLFMSVVLFVSAASFTDYLTEASGVGLAPSGFDLQVSLSGDRFKRISPEELLGQIRKATAVTEGAYTQSRYFTAQIQTADLTREGIDFLAQNQGNAGEAPVRYADGLLLTFVDDSTFRAMLQKNALDEKTFMDSSKPLGIALDGGMTFDILSQRYVNTTFFNKTAFSMQLQRFKDVPGYSWAGEIVDQKGNELIIFTKEDGGQNEKDMMFLSPEEAYVYSACHVGYVTYDTPFFDSNRNGIRIVYPISLAQQVIADFDATDAHYQYTICSADHNKSYSAVKTVLINAGFETVGLRNVASEEESERNMLIIIRVFSYGFVALISLIAAANVFNTISTNIALRRREFAMLRSVGMEQKAFRRMMNYECLLYGSRSLLWGLPVACGVTYLIYRAMLQGYETTFKLPWSAMGIATLSVFLVVFVTMMYAMSKLKQEDPIQVLKNENI